MPAHRFTIRGAAFMTLTLMTSCQHPPIPPQQVVYDGGKHSLEFIVVPESSQMAGRFRHGSANATSSTEGFVTLQVQAVSSVWPLAYRFEWQGADGMVAMDPSANAWRRMEQDSGHPVVLTGTSTTRFPARASLRIRKDH
jgi:hypothetical protein